MWALLRDRMVRFYCWLTGQPSVIRCTMCGLIMQDEKSAVSHIQKAHPEIMAEYEIPIAEGRR